MAVDVKPSQPSQLLNITDEFIKPCPNHERGLESPVDGLIPLGGEEGQKVQVELWGEATHFIILSRACLPVLPGEEGETGSRAVWLGAKTLEPGGLSLNPCSATLELCDLGYANSLLCGLVSPLQNRFQSCLNYRSRCRRAALHFIGENVNI